MKILGIDHIGIAVDSIDSAESFWADVLGLHSEGRETVVEQKVTTAFLPVGGSEVELLESTAPDGPVARFIEKQLNGRSVSDLDWQTPEGIRVKPVYTADDLEKMEHLGGMPGFGPYVRGPMSTMYAGRPWTIRQYAGFSTAKEANAFYRRNLAPGHKGLSVAFDLHCNLAEYGSMRPRG